jgi:hypothetical protein
MNHTRFPKEDHLPDWARRDNQFKKSDRVDDGSLTAEKTAWVTYDKHTEAL